MTDSNTTADTAFEKAKAEETTLAATESANDEVTTDAESHNKKRKTEENYIQCFNNEMKQMSRTGMDWYYANETAQRDIKRLQEEVAAKDADLARMREADDKNRTTIQNLIWSAESYENDTTRKAMEEQTESKLRAELIFMTEKRDEAIADAETAKRKAALYSDELLTVKSKLQRVTHEKIKLEREARVALTADVQVYSDLDYYKRKTTELTGHMQGLNAVISEKNRALDEMRRQQERNMSQHRLELLREGGIKRRL